MASRRPYLRDQATGQMRGQRRVMLTPAQVKTVIECLAAGMSRDQVARAAGVSINVLERRYRDQLKGLKRRGKGAGGGRRPEPEDDPTPEEIWGRLTKDIQAGWTDEQRDNAAYGAFKRPGRAV